MLFVHYLFPNFPKLHALWLYADIRVGAVFLYIDILIGVLVIFLLFKHNEWWFHVLCKCCVCCVYDGQITTLRLEHAWSASVNATGIADIVKETQIELEISQGGNAVSDKHETTRDDGSTEPSEKSGEDF